MSASASYLKCSAAFSTTASKRRDGSSQTCFISSSQNMIVPTSPTLSLPLYHPLPVVSVCTDIGIKGFKKKTKREWVKWKIEGAQQNVWGVLTVNAVITAGSVILSKMLPSFRIEICLVCGCWLSFSRQRKQKIFTAIVFQFQFLGYYTSMYYTTSTVYFLLYRQGYVKSLIISVTTPVALAGTICEETIEHLNNTCNNSN